MKPVIVFQHVQHETLGSLESCFQELDLSWEYVELFGGGPHRFDVAEACGLVVLGGPMNVDEVELYPFLGPEVGWIRRAVEAKLPYLGICLGSQLLAKALGATVFPNRVKEIGWYPIDLTPEAAADPLFDGCAPRETVFQWHGDTFDLPRGTVHLATSDLCRHQAFRFGDSAWGLQFHIEMTEALIDDWLGNGQNCDELAGLDYIDPRDPESHARKPALDGTLGRAGPSPLRRSLRTYD